MKHYYISNPKAERGFDEITEAEWNAIIGQPPVSGYANRVYRGSMTIDEVAEEHRAEVETIVANKIAKWGEYKDQAVSASELQNLIEEVL